MKRPLKLVKPDWKEVSKLKLEDFEKLLNDLEPQVSENDHERLRKWNETQLRLEQDAVADKAEIPPRIMEQFRDGALDLNQHPNAALRHALRSQDRLIALFGPPGTGKSVAACVALLDALRGRYVRADRYVTTAKSFDSHDKYLTELWDTTTFLVVDDVGEEPERDAHLIERLINSRYDLGAGFTTILTSNLDSKTFASRYTDRTVSRLREVGRGIYCGDVVRPNRRAK